ncbi:MAG: GNAT family N-acetyltransferase [Myxococcota bacterium]
MAGAPVEPEPTIRPASAGDRQSILELWLELIAHHDRLDPEGAARPIDREALLAEFTRSLERPQHRVWLAREAGRAIGFVSAEIDGATGWIHELYVVEGWRRRGLARALVQVSGGWLRESGAGSVRVRVEPMNRVGLEFWARQGFSERARILEG